jgi:hypothetical protein
MTSTERRRTGARATGRLAMIAVLFAAAGTLSGCFGHEAAGQGSGPPAAGASPVVTAPLHVRSGVTRVVGELAPDARKHLADRAGALVAAYFRAAFLEPASRRLHGSQLFPGFTPGATALATQDRAVLTGAAYAGADRITPKGATAYVNVLAPKGHVVGATVRVTLALSVTTHARTRPVDVAGRLLLTPTSGGWRVFGYAVSQSGRSARSTR